MTAHLGDVDAVRQSRPEGTDVGAPASRAAVRDGTSAVCTPMSRTSVLMRLDSHRHAHGQPPAPHRQDHGVHPGQNLDDLETQVP